MKPRWYAVLLTAALLSVALGCDLDSALSDASAASARWMAAAKPIDTVAALCDMTLSRGSCAGGAAWGTADPSGPHGTISGAAGNPGSSCDGTTDRIQQRLRDGTCLTQE